MYRVSKKNTDYIVHFGFPSMWQPIVFTVRVPGPLGED